MRTERKRLIFLICIRFVYLVTMVIIYALALPFTAKNDLLCLVLFGGGVALFWESFQHYFQVLSFGELQYGMGIFRFISNKRWKEKKRAIAGAAIVYWMEGNFEKARETLQLLPEQERYQNEAQFFLIRGWEAFQAGSGEMLSTLWEKKTEDGKKRKVPVEQILKSWQAILERNWDFEWKPCSATGVLGLDIHNAYWAGFWYMASGNREKAVEQFLYVWIKGDKTQLAEKARYALEGWGVALPKQEVVPRKAFRWCVVREAAIFVATVSLSLILGSFL